MRRSVSARRTSPKEWATRERPCAGLSVQLAGAFRSRRWHPGPTSYESSFVTVAHRPTVPQKSPGEPHEGGRRGIAERVPGVRIGTARR